MIPASLRTLLDETTGQRRAEWAGREVWLANEAWGELALSLQGGQLLHHLPAGAPDAPEDARAAGSSERRYAGTRGHGAQRLAVGNAHAPGTARDYSWRHPALLAVVCR